jgi:hypothetical protein
MHREPFRDHRAPAHLGRHLIRQHMGGELGQFLEPPQRQPCEQRALSRDARLEHMVERAHPVAGDDEQPVRIVVEWTVEITDLAGVDVLPAGDPRGGHDTTRAAMSVRY